MRFKLLYSICVLYASLLQAESNFQVNHAVNQFIYAVHHPVKKMNTLKHTDKDLMSLD